MNKLGARVHNRSFALLRRIFLLVVLLISLGYVCLSVPVFAQKVSLSNLQHVSKIGANNHLAMSFAVSYITLAVDVPSQVSVTLDGVQEGAGSRVLQLSPGMHAISVPDMVQLDSTSRLRFDGWLDGFTQSTRALDLEANTNMTARYVTQYYVSVTSDCTLESGWYDVLAVVHLSVNQTLPNKYRLYTGGFDGWYSNGRLVSKSPIAPFVVYDPVNVTARWNYFPYLLPLLAGAIIVVILVLSRGGGLSAVSSRKLKIGKGSVEQQIIRNDDGHKRKRQPSGFMR